MRASKMVHNAATKVRSTTASGSAVYESERAVHEYLQFHYGDPKEVVPYAFAPQDALSFVPRTVEFAVQHVSPNQRRRALDVGCAVGRATFEMTKSFDEAVGIDFSHHFAETAQRMRAEGSLSYDALVQGDIWETRKASLPAGINSDRARFEQGDACNLSPALGKFDLVFASNLLCRLPNPRKFLNEIGGFVNEGGVLALISPYSWLEEYTRKDQWVGASRDENGKALYSFDRIQSMLEKDFELVERKDFPFIIREHERKYQWGVSDGTVWKRK